MNEDSGAAPLARRAPGGSGGPRPPVGISRPVMSEAVQRLARAAIDAARAEQVAERARERVGPGDDQAEPGGERTGFEEHPGGEVEPSDERVEPGVVFGAPGSGVDPDADTQPIAAIVTSGAGVIGTAATDVAVRPSPERAALPHSLPEPDAGLGGSGSGSVSRRYRLAGALASVVLLAGAGALSFALWRSTAGGPSGGSHGNPAATGAAAQAVRTQAASWVATQVSRSAVVSCDPVMCQALAAHGVPTATLRTLSPAGAGTSGGGQAGATGTPGVAVSPLGSAVVVVTSVVRAEYGSPLASVYAPVVLASFGSGSLRIDIRVVAPHGAAAYLSQVRTDVQNRRADGAVLLRSPLVAASAKATAQLTGGQVDARLLVTLANLAALQPVTIVSFGGATTGASAGVPLRSAELAASGHGSGRANRSYVRSMLQFLRGEHGQYRAARIQTVRLAGGQAVLSIEFAAPSPLGLLGLPGSPGGRKGLVTRDSSGA